MKKDEIISELKSIERKSDDLVEELKKTEKRLFLLF